MRSPKALIGDYSVSHLSTLVTQATAQAEITLNKAQDAQAQVDLYFDKADYYRSISLTVTPVISNNSEVDFVNETNYRVYSDNSGNHYIKHYALADQSQKWLVLAGDITVITPLPNSNGNTPANIMVDYFVRLNQDANGGWQLSNFGTSDTNNTLANQLTATSKIAYLGDFNNNGQQDLVVVADTHPAGQYLAAATPALVENYNTNLQDQREQLLAIKSKKLNLTGVALTNGEQSLYYNLDNQHNYLRKIDKTRHSERFVLIAAEINIPIELPVEQYIKVNYTNGQFYLSVETDNLAHPDFAANFQRSTKKVHIGDLNQDGIRDLAIVAPAGSNENFTDIGPVGLSFFTQLAHTADQITEVAEFLQKQAHSYTQLADNLLILAETSHRQAVALDLWVQSEPDQYVQDFQSLQNDADYVTFWRAKKRDAEGRLTNAIAGSGLTTTKNYDPATGQLLSIQSGFFYSQKIRNLAYQYDLLNNLTSRADLVQEVNESFSYDALDRLVQASVSSNLYPDTPYNHNQSYSYDTTGNLVHKSSLGSMQYGAGNAGPHAVTSVNNGAQFGYDANGNMTQGRGRTIAYNSSNKPSVITKDGKQVSFSYAPDESRYLKLSANTSTLYLDKVYERVTDISANTVSHKNMIYADGKLVATNVDTVKADNSVAQTARYMHYDPLGSIDTITGPKGEVVDRLSYDPFGARRPGDWRVDLTAVLNPFTNRGFTGHEHIAEVGLIHMNGRVYDPELGRFLSADRLIQSPLYSQNFNRYSYVMNNPLKYTDPTGWRYDDDRISGSGEVNGGGWGNGRSESGGDRDRNVSPNLYGRRVNGRMVGGGGGDRDNQSDKQRRDEKQAAANRKAQIRERERIIEAANRNEQVVDMTCNPINIATGEKYLTMYDYQSVGASELKFIRAYSSYTQEKTTLGYGWRTNYDQKLTFSQVTNDENASPWQVTYTKSNGKLVTFTRNAQGMWQASEVAAEKLEITNQAWQVTLANGSKQAFDSKGRLTSITKLGGYQLSLSYNNRGQLTQVIDSFKLALAFSYNSSGLLHSLTDPDGHITYYRYDLQKQVLTQVLYPDNTPTLSDNPYKRYLYQDNRYPTAITCIKNELGQRLHTMAYDNQGRAILSELGDHAERVDVVFNNLFGTGKQNTVRTSLGRETTYFFDKNDKPVSITGHATASCVASNQAYTYDERQNITTKTDWKGVATHYQYNDRNLETQRIEAIDTEVERSIKTSWHPDFPLPTQIVTPGLTSQFSYNDQGLLIKRTDIDTLSQQSAWQKLTASYPNRTTKFAYNSQGLISSVDGPLKSSADITYFSYDDKGNRIGVENALGHRSTTTAFDNSGRPLNVIDANGVETQLSYNQRGWLTSKTLVTEQGAATTHYQYLHSGNYAGQGQVSKVSLPNGNSIDYQYDTAYRLIAVSNSQGTTINYRLDLQGNRIAQTTTAADGKLLHSQRQVFDELSRLLQSIGADNQTTTYQYDKNGNLNGLTDPLNNKTQYAFDPLNRLVATTDANAGVLQHTYNQQHQLTSVTDQRGLTTRYQYNGFGEKVALISPDTGTTQYRYNKAGLLIAKTDARDIETLYQYDLLGRVTHISYPQDRNNDISYLYDHYLNDPTDQTSTAQIALNKSTDSSRNYALGRLTQVRDPSGSTQNYYNQFGQIRRQNYTIDGVQYQTTHAYNDLGELIGTTYPSGREVTIQRNQYGQIAHLTTQTNSLQNLSSVKQPAPQLIVSNLAYSAGVLRSMQYANGTQLDIQRDLDTRIGQIKLTAANDNNFYQLDYQYDTASNVTAINDRINSQRSQHFSYDNLYRLIDASGQYGQVQYQYDAVGNRISRQLSAQTSLTSLTSLTAQHSLTSLVETYDYAHDSNRLIAVAKHTGDNTHSERLLSYDAVGNIVDDKRNAEHSLALIYGANNRLQQVDNNNTQRANPIINSASSYKYNAKGQRVSKLVKQADGSTKTIHFHYNSFDQMMAETDITGKVLKEYLYVDGQRVASVDYLKDNSGELVFVHNDHLGTPQLMTGLDAKVLWQSNTLPFGEELQKVTNARMNLKFPGQYLDQETGYSQNYFRDYDASLGRYIQSDPIGLMGGVNTFAYVGGNPVGAVDVYGLNRIGWIEAASKALGLTAPTRNGLGPRDDKDLANAGLRAASGASTASFGFTAVIAGAGGSMAIPVGFVAIGSYEFGQGLNEVSKHVTGKSLSGWSIGLLTSAGVLTDFDAIAESLLAPTNVSTIRGYQSNISSCGAP